MPSMDWETNMHRGSSRWKLRWGIPVFYFEDFLVKEEVPLHQKGAENAFPEMQQAYAFGGFTVEGERIDIDDELQQRLMDEVEAVRDIVEWSQEAWERLEDDLFFSAEDGVEEEDKRRHS